MRREFRAVYYMCVGTSPCLQKVYFSKNRLQAAWHNHGDSVIVKMIFLATSQIDGYCVKEVHAVK